MKVYEQEIYELENRLKEEKKSCDKKVGELNYKLEEENKRNLAFGYRVCQEDCDRRIEELEKEVSDLEYAVGDAKAYLDKG